MKKQQPLKLYAAFKFSEHKIENKIYGIRPKKGFHYHDDIHIPTIGLFI